jgi:DNA repair protein RadC
MPRKRDAVREMPLGFAALVEATEADDLGGHRGRMRERMLKGGPDGFLDHEILEYVLALAIPRQDTKDRAKALLKRFGGLAGVLSARPEELAQVDGIGTSTAVALRFVGTAAQRMHRSAALPDARRTEVRTKTAWDEDLRGRGKPLSSLDSVLAYLTARQGALIHEEFRVLFLNTKNHLLADEAQEGTVNHAPAYPREIVRRALELGATALILVHNHPSGDPSPSRDDIALTRRVVEAARLHDIAVHDHLIIGRDAHASLRSLGHIA